MDKKIITTLEKINTLVKKLEKVNAELVDVVFPNNPIKCEQPECEKDYLAKGMCRKHYDYWRRHK